MQVPFFRLALLLPVFYLQQACVAANTPDSTANLAGRDNPATSEMRFSDKHLDLVITDLVTALVQVHELTPLTTTLQVSNPRGNYGKKLVKVLDKAGYGIQWVSADQGDNYLSYQNRTIQSDSRDIRDFTIKVGDIEVRREYQVKNGRVAPVSIVYVSGSSSFTNILLNSDLFLQQGGKFDFPSGAEFSLIDESIRTTDVEKVINDGSTEVTSVSQDEALRSVLSARDLVLNSVSDSLLQNKDTYPPLRKALLKFIDGALVLGQTNKEIVQQMLRDFDPEADAFFISACPFGDQPQTHADRHVTRLKEELVLNQVMPTRVVEEGCALEEYPDGKVDTPHTAVLTQRRLIGNLDAMKNTPTTYESFPNRPLALTVPYSLGGSTDFQARVITMMAAEEDVLGQSILTINKPGTAGRDGWSWFMETAGNTGYDLATYSVPDFIAQSIKHSTQYNIDSLEPIANWGADPVVLVVAGNSEFKFVEDLLRFVEANPRRLSVSGGGEFISHHIALMQLEKAGNFSMLYRPATSTDEALKQVLTGNVMAGFTDMSAAIRQNNGVRILAVADIKRNAAIPSVPTFAELGFDVDDSSVNYRGLMVPKGTPAPVVDALSEAALRMIKHPTVAQRMKEAGAPLQIMDRKETLEFWKRKQSALTRFFKDT